MTMYNNLYIGSGKIDHIIDVVFLELGSLVCLSLESPQIDRYSVSWCYKILKQRLIPAPISCALDVVGELPNQKRTLHEILMLVCLLKDAKQCSDISRTYSLSVCITMQTITTEHCLTKSLTTSLLIGWKLTKRAIIGSDLQYSSKHHTSDVLA